MSQSEIWILLLAHPVSTFPNITFGRSYYRNWKDYVNALNTAYDDFDARFVLSGSVVKEFNWWLYNLDSNRQNPPPADCITYTDASKLD